MHPTPGYESFKRIWPEEVIDHLDCFVIRWLDYLEPNTASRSTAD